MLRFIKTRDLLESLLFLVKSPVTKRFPRKAHQPFESFRGKPQFVESECVGCGACAEICPSHAIQVIDPKHAPSGKKQIPRRKIELRYDACNFCGLCRIRCITGKGIRMTDQFDLALFDRSLASESIEKELAFCERCGRILTTLDHLRWIFRRLGVIAYSNPTLFRAAQKVSSRPDLKPSGEAVRREDMMKILCPACRRRVHLKDAWGSDMPAINSKSI
jgi:hydrogenase-4 component H